jgi:hypothetical protein
MNINLNKVRRHSKVFILILLMVVTFSYKGASQIQKGQWLTGGNAGFSYFKYYTTKTSSWSLSPTGAYFVLDQLALGLRPGYYGAVYKVPSGIKSKETFVSITPFVRYYFLAYEHKVNLFADAGFGYSWGKYKSYSAPDFTYHSKIISFKAGPAIFLNERTAVEVTLGYDHSIRGSLGDTLGVKSFQVGVGLQIHLGKRTD